jgi:hydrogenase maturation protein HypF
MNRPDGFAADFLQVRQAARRFHIDGRVQGVGFRPFLARLAHELGLAGEVVNCGGWVEGVVEGSAQEIAVFLCRLMQSPPEGAIILDLRHEPVDVRGRRGFDILPAQLGEDGERYLPPDCAPCPDCLAELSDPADRRYRYPFITCAVCGPRVSLLASLPWERAHSGMAGFAPCPACLGEYYDPSNRRFHAESIACPACGPRLWLVRDGGRLDGDSACLAAAVQVLREGGILALKGVSGYQLLCDAGNEAGVRRLRERKRRPSKPLAVMFPWSGSDGLEAVRCVFALDANAAGALAASARPIVLLRPSGLAPRLPALILLGDIAPGLAEIGIMLPSSPLHHLLLEEFGGAVVATSGNRSGEPLASAPEEAERRLAGIADAFLHHDRPILWPMDDPLRRVIGDCARPLRLGRGDAPLELELPFAFERIWLAVGGQMKNAVALGWGRRAVLSPHVGELDSTSGLARFESTVVNMQARYERRAEAIAHDAHPGYVSTRWARAQDLPQRAVQHHAAHASALYAEAWMEHGKPPEDMLVLVWDGLGYGADGGLWGGEALLGHPGQWRRVASLCPFRLPGGERAAREAWRCACGLCWEAGRDWGGAPEGMDAELLHAAWARGLNAPLTSSMGRLFDAAAALLGLCPSASYGASYEGEAAMRLEAAAAGHGAVENPLELAWRQEDILRLDWMPLLDVLLDVRRPLAERAACFHASLARAAVCLARELGAARVGLSGGVMQNRLLVESIHAEAERAGLQVFFPARVPVNDAGLAFGQLVEAHFMECSV